MSGEILPSDPVDVELEEVEEEVEEEEEEDKPTTNYEEMDLELDSADDFELQVLRMCKKFTKMTNDLDDKRSRSLVRNRNAHEVLNQATKSKETAREDVERKESNLTTLRTQLELLQRQVTSAGVNLEESREFYDQRVKDEETANKEFRYSVKEFHKYQAADQAWVRYLVKFFEERKRSFIYYSKKAIQ